MGLVKKSNLLRDTLSPKRYRHSLRVAEFSKKIAQANNVSEEAAYLAGLLHDNARELSEDELMAVAKENDLNLTLLELENPILLHAKVGAWRAQKLFGVEDRDILKAIAHHTLGAPKMSTLEKIIYVADFSEPARDFELARSVRELVFCDLDRAVEVKLTGVVQYFH